jgi:uncharacterized protein
MAETSQKARQYPTLRQRVAFLVIYGLGLYFVAALVTSSWRPTGGGKWLWWMSAIALYLFNTLSAPFFVRPRDALANAVGSALMLFTLDLAPVQTLRPELEAFRWATFGLAVLAAILAITAVALQGVTNSDNSWRGKLSRMSYQLAVPIGHEAVLFTPPALISIVGFYQENLTELLWLAAMWVLIVAMKPVQIFVQVWGTVRQAKAIGSSPEMIGTITRVDDPNIIRVTLTSIASWKADRLHLACLPGNRCVEVIPLFVQTQNNELIGTGLCCDGEVDASIGEAQVWTAPEAQTDEVIQRLAGSDGPANLIGFVIEESSISAVRFEVAQSQPLQEGAVVFVRDREQTVYYQVLDAVTKEEVFTQNPRGTHVVVAGQLGTLNTERGFRKYGWVPPMNAPVFLPRPLTIGPPTTASPPDEFTLGAVAQTGLSVKASLRDMADYHTAVLGVTGTGKTELVLDLIRAHVKAGRKVFCVDCTGEYEPRLADLAPKKLGFDATGLTKLDELVNATEHGAYGGADDKKRLHEWVGNNRASVDKAVTAFMTADKPSVGIFDLPDIANTRATLRATEMYISSIFAWAKKNRKARDVVVVLEEAHTVVPEWNLYSHDKADTDSVVGRMAQIALQGRKFGVGLLLVSQRTALVSKTLLSQCNTCICFAMYDKTGLDYLASVFASEHVRAIPNLRFLQGIAFGKAIKSERPIIFEIPDDPVKRKASIALNKTLATPAADAVAPPAVMEEFPKTDGLPATDEDDPF